MKIQRKYFIIFSSVFIVISLFITFTAYYLSNYILLQKFKEMNEENLNYILKITDKELDQLNHTFDFLTNNTVILKRIETDYSTKGDYEKLIDDMNVTHTLDAMNSFDIFDSIEAIYMSGNNGQEYLYGFLNNNRENEILSNELSQLEIEEPGLIFIGIEKSRVTLEKNKDVLKFVRNLYDEYGQKSGIIYIELNAKYFERLFANENFTNGTKIYFVDQNNKIIYNNSSYSIGEKLKKENLEGVCIEQNVSRYGWKLISETYKDQILDDSKMIIEITLFTAVLSIIIELLLILFITRKIFSPIKKLTEAMVEIKSGNLNIQVYNTSDDEIGQLTDNFNSMTKELKNNLDNEINYQKAIKDAEYKALQAQINPHFLYNSLNALKWMASIQKADNIISMVNSLWKLLKMTSSFNGQYVTLEDELEVIEAYGKIQQVRYKGKFEIKYNVQKEHMQKIIPKYILQPIVENSIFHGIEPKKGPGIIEIKSFDKDGDIFIKVIDDGVGMDEERLNKILKEDSRVDKGRGLNNIGTRNVDQRLKLLYGNNYGVMIESKVEKGTVVTIMLPSKNAEEKR